MYDVLIEGAGPAGVAAAVYCARAGLNTAVLRNFLWADRLRLQAK